MKLYDATGPNPRVVRMFLQEKELEIPTVVMVLGNGENRHPSHLARNPMGQVPVLETDDGAYISETLAICEYLEELHPEPSLVGRTLAQRGETRMWTRRVDLNICEPLMYTFRFSSVGWRRFRNRNPRAPQAADAMGRVARTNLAWLDGQMAHREFLCGDRFSLADVLLYVFVQSGIEVGQLLDPQWLAVTDWFKRVAARPSATRSAQCRVESMALSSTV